MSWLLSDEQIGAVLEDYHEYARIAVTKENKAVAKAQLQHYIKQGNELCHEHCHGQLYRFQCPDCWRNLCREAGKE